jgi:hypothetical protein
MNISALASRSPIGTRVSTGHKCPESGVWRVDSYTDSTTAPIAKNNVMPPYKQKAVTWILQSYA